MLYKKLEAVYLGPCYRDLQMGLISIWELRIETNKLPDDRALELAKRNPRQIFSLDSQNLGSLNRDSRTWILTEREKTSYTRNSLQFKEKSNWNPRNPSGRRGPTVAPQSQQVQTYPNSETQKWLSAIKLWAATAFSHVCTHISAL